MKNTLRANQTIVFEISLLNRLKSYCKDAGGGISAFARDAIRERLDKLQAPMPEDPQDMNVESLFAPVIPLTPNTLDNGDKHASNNANTGTDSTVEDL